MSKSIMAGLLERLAYNIIMTKLLSAALVLGFLFVDFLFFHDMFKAGETISIAQYLTGFLSLLVFASAAPALVKSTR